MIFCVLGFWTLQISLRCIVGELAMEMSLALAVGVTWCDMRQLTDDMRLAKCDKLHVTHDIWNMIFSFLVCLAKSICISCATIRTCQEFQCMYPAGRNNFFLFSKLIMLPKNYFSMLLPEGTNKGTFTSLYCSSQVRTHQRSFSHVKGH